MSGRNRGPPMPMKGMPHAGMPRPVHEPAPFPRGLGPLVHHPALLDDMREPHMGIGGPRQLPPHPAIIEEQLAAQHDDIQGLLIDNQRLAATHVALKQELEVVQFELQRTHKYAGALHAEKDAQLRELHEKSVKMQADLQGADAMRSELMQVHTDVNELRTARQELTSRAQLMTEDLARMTAELQQVPAIRAEIDGLKQELIRVRSAIEYEKKGYAENFEHGQVMEKKLVSMARELEKLRAEVANAQKRSHASAAMVNQGTGYNANYVNPEAGYPVNPYPPNYGIDPPNSMHHMQTGMEGYPQYGPGPGAWGTYDVQRSQGPR
ncbi:OLC1v1023336C1 [Oldenlandia corymbosa var. corymbosa]|uniref:OLC1v1023336C1 n=1 Tax=Oldenlandia corymbosa var. corymbosa TaxID=529605 RepID=A0AAV1BZR5_OLDCO|nr:OLC1v1023336C1 [Oldenlandia corymbosa var. corymbosa]